MDCGHCGRVLTNSKSPNLYPNGSRPTVEMSRKLVDSPELTVTFVSEAHIPTNRGCFRMRAYRDSSSGTEPIALISGKITPANAEGVPTRIHDSCFTSEVIGSLKCDCKDQLDYAMDYILRKGPGVLVYLQQEGRGIGLANKILAYAVQEHGVDTVDANTKLGFESDARQYLCVPHILKDCGIKSVSLMTNNPRKIERLRALDVVVSDRIPVVVASNPHSEHYLKTKAARMGHLLPFAEKTPSSADGVSSKRKADPSTDNHGHFHTPTSTASSPVSKVSFSKRDLPSQSMSPISDTPSSDSVKLSTPTHPAPSSPRTCSSPSSDVGTRENNPAGADSPPARKKQKVAHPRQSTSPESESASSSTLLSMPQQPVLPAALAQACAASAASLFSQSLPSASTMEITVPNRE